MGLGGVDAAEPQRVEQARRRVDGHHVDPPPGDRGAERERGADRGLADAAGAEAYEQPAARAGRAMDARRSSWFRGFRHPVGFRRARRIRRIVGFDGAGGFYGSAGLAGLGGPGLGGLYGLGCKRPTSSSPAQLLEFSPAERRAEQHRQFDHAEPGAGRFAARRAAKRPAPSRHRARRAHPGCAFGASERVECRCA